MAAEAKTKPTSMSFDEFLQTSVEEDRHVDCRILAAIMTKATGENATVWGTSIVGFSRYKPAYADGREAEWPIVGFSPRKRELVLYIMPGFSRYTALLEKLGKHRAGKSCLYVKALAGLDMGVLSSLIHESVEAMKATHQ